MKILESFIVSFTFTALKSRNSSLRDRCVTIYITAEGKLIFLRCCVSFFHSNSQSDDNLLKNIELFDKLSLRFNGRILFIKDLIGNNEICCWTFYGNGKKLAEVCCTSIVYATEKPQTKVEFPDSRIYEESLNVLLYEHRGTGNLPDAELLSATRRAVGPRVIPESDEEPSRRQDKNRWRKRQSLNWIVTCICGICDCVALHVYRNLSSSMMKYTDFCTQAVCSISPAWKFVSMD